MFNKLICRHQGPTIHNDGSSLLDLSLNSYTVLIIEMQDESGPYPDLSVFLASLNQFSLLDSECKTYNFPKHCCILSEIEFNFTLNFGQHFSPVNTCYSCRVTYHTNKQLKWL